MSATALAALVLCLMSLVFGPAASAQDALTQGLFGQASPGQRTPAQGGAPQDQSGQDVSQGPISPLHFAPRPPQPPKKPAPPSNQPMLVQATEIRYDYTNNTVSAVGN
ncbi:MAG: hypothetical protein WBF47_27455, partial [Xanthobacteraceae bacterium]